MAVNDVKLSSMLEYFGDMEVFGYFRIDAAVFLVSLVDHRVESSAGDRIPGGEQSHIPAARDESFGDIAGNGFPSAVLPGRRPPCNR